MSVGYLRSSVSREGLYIVAHPTAEDPRDKHPHPPSRCARQQISQEPTMEPPKAPPGCGYCALRPMRGYRKRPDSRGAPGSFKCPVYSTDTLHPRLTSLAEDILVHSVILLSCVISYGNVGSLYCGVVIYLMKEERAEESAHVSVSGYKSKDSIPMCFCNMPENPPMGLATNRMDAMPAGIAMLFFDADSGPDMTDLTDST
ncbi:hypothetical protein DPMN_093076 [Dreissena polymorpha]|uniref:Uncharacterized protein n=1 Tax=Dreissena polymorpha TaxID=45954 RepID=A0A9D4R0L5_DREPO|nr:hypothetical protein DPMN_093076 [Dreissena polymorpha]